MSTITVTGRLTSDPELRFTPAGRAVINLRIAENHSRRTADGAYEDAGTSFYNVTRWSGQNSSIEVETIAGSLHKGDLVLITGRFSTRDYTTRDQQVRTSLEITADEIGASFRGQTLTISRTARATDVDAPVDYEPAH